VPINSNLQKTFESFEESWGAYVMYSIVRANSILKKVWDFKFSEFEKIDIENLDNIEKQILNEITKFPLIVKQAWENHNPAVIAEFTLTLSRFYNSYYNSHRVLDNDKVIYSRVFITNAVSIVLKNALKICHIDVPERI
jgi:arginyl-tRNA synthetase